MANEPLGTLSPDELAQLPTDRRPPLSSWPVHWELTWKEKGIGQKKIVRVFDTDIRESCVCVFDLHNPSDTFTVPYDDFFELYEPIPEEA